MVNLNDRLDYFGSTVNMAARLQGQSEGGDIVSQPRRADDPRWKLLGHEARRERPAQGLRRAGRFRAGAAGAGSA